MENLRENSMPVEFTSEEARLIGEQLGVDWSEFDVEQFRMGLNVELEHGSAHPDLDVTGDDPLATGKIALVHLRELPDYYTRHALMESEQEEPFEEEPSETQLAKFIRARRTVR